MTERRIATGDELAKQLLEVFGIGTKDIVRVQVDLRPREVATIKLECVLRSDGGNVMQPIFKNYILVEADKLEKQDEL